MAHLFFDANDRADDRGFTLVELMVAMALLGVAMAAIYSSYFSQQKSYVVQTQVVAMQQNLRAAMHMMASDIRMAGYDKENTGNFGLVSPLPDGQGAVDATNIAFTIDLDEDGNLDNATDTEMIAYRLNANNIEKYGAASGWQIIARDIEVLNFIYLDSNRAETADLSSVRFVEISVLARTARADLDYANNNLYRNQQADLLFAGTGDNLRRKLLTSFIKCRNLGI